VEGKICIVTGSNTGIGKETARGLAQRGATVVLACRDVAKAEAARADIAASTGRGDLAVMPLDLGDKASVRAFAAAFRARYARLDVLVNNAGVYARERGTTRDGFETTFGVNHLGTFLLTQELLPLIRASAPARIVTVSSNMHRSGEMVWDDLMFERRRFWGVPVYQQSKLANVLHAFALARRLAGTGVTVNALHPGVVGTEIMRGVPRLLTAPVKLFLLSPEKGAACSLHVATAAELAGVTGEYFEKSRVGRPAAAARDEAAQERLWEVSERLVA
jgi:NAD(P)-dependent dehydrogenase (short-subunit alcohol dehydrogenase family)